MPLKVKPVPKKSGYVPPEGPSPELLAVIGADDQPANPDTLQTLRVKTARVRDLELELAELEDRADALKREKSTLLTKELPELLQMARVPGLTIEAEGNKPSFAIALKDYCSANISASWPDDQREAAFKLLEKLGAGDLIKMVLSIEFGRGTAKLQKEVLAVLKKFKLPVSIRKTVPHSSLAAWIRERHDRGDHLSTSELETLGASVGQIAHLKEVKAKKRS